MHKLILALGALFLVAPLALAQTWTFQGQFPDDTNPDIPRPHGLVVDSGDKVWVQPWPALNPFDGATWEVAVDPLPPNCDSGTGMCPTNVVHVYNADGTEASFSPINELGLPGEAQYLGGYVDTNGDWVARNGLGIVTDATGENIYISQGGTLFKIDASGNALAAVNPVDLPTLTAAGVDGSGNVYVTGVVPGGGPIKIYNSDLDFVGHVQDAIGSIQRTLIVSDDGNSVIVPSIGGSNELNVLYQRPDPFSPYDSVGVTLEGLVIESTTVNRATGEYWVSSGPSCCIYPDLELWDSNTWYGFDFQDILDNPVPTATESILWEGAPPDTTFLVNQRGLAFSSDGNTAYATELNSPSPAVQMFGRTIGVEDPARIPDVAELHANRPNPVSGATTFSFDLHEAANVSLRVFDMTGREVAVVAEGAYLAGQYTERFDASNLAAGVYAYTLEVDGRVLSRRMTVVR